MQPEHWQKVKALLQSALELAPDKREAFLNEACAEDVELRQEVESYIKAHKQADNFIEEPVFEVAAPLWSNLQSDIRTGETVGSYKIIEKLGEGGMGVVYLAVDSRLGRKIALKLLPAHYASDGERLRRFQQEARAASALNHPNILTIHEIRQTNDGKHFIASEFVEGETLRQKLQNPTFSLIETLEIVIQIAAALSAAHEAGIVHRDIKPENVMVRPDGLVKVLDFGLAKLIENKNASLDTDIATLPQVQTNPGVVMGTFAYMSPEQTRGKEIDARTDIWSLGVVLYEMLTGKMPFAGETTSDTITAILSKKPAPLAHYVSDVPKELERIVSKTLRKDREERYQNIKDLLIDLRDLKRELELESEFGTSEATGKANQTKADKLPTVTNEQKAQPTSRTKYFTNRIKNRKVIIALALIILLTVAVILGYNFLTPAKSDFDFEMGLRPERRTSNGTVKIAVISPDGEFIIYVQDEKNEQQSLRMQNVENKKDTPILPTAGIKYHGLNISPDGKDLYYLDAQGSLYQMKIPSGEQKKVADGLMVSSDNHHIAISPDGKQIAFVRSIENGVTALFIANADGSGGSKQIAFVRNIDNKVTALSIADGSDKRIRSPFVQLIGLAQYLAWSPDGEEVIACLSVNDDGSHSILTVHADGTSALIIEIGRQSIKNLIWMPGSDKWASDSNSKKLLVVTDTGYGLNQIRQITYPGGGQSMGTINKDAENDYSFISMTSDGSSLVAVRTQLPAHIWTMPINDWDSAKQLSDGIDAFHGKNFLNWLPNGEIVYSSRLDDKSSVLKMKADGTSNTDLITDAISPTVSPDGHYLVYINGAGNDYRLHQTDLINYSGKPLMIGMDYWAAFSPDGKWLVYTKYNKETSSDYAVSLHRRRFEDGNLIDQQDFIQYGKPTCREISPDGKWIPFVLQKEGQPNQIALLSLEDGEIKPLDTKLDAGASCPLVSPNSKMIAFVLLKAGEPDRIALAPFDGGEIVKKFNVKSEIANSEIQNLQWTPDGRAINYIALNNGVSNIWRQPIDGSSPVQITKFETGRIFNFAYSPDGKQLALSRGTLNSDVVLIKNSESPK